MSILNYKCPCCEAPLTFKSETQKWDCEYCSNSYELSTLEMYYAEKEEDLAEGELKYEPLYDSEDAGWSEYEKSQIRVFSCPSCGAEIIADENTAATKCQSCGNAAVLPKQLSGMYRPNYIIPFKINKDGARNALQNFLRGKPFLPSGFVQQLRVGEISGSYVPFWLYNCDVNADITFDATRVSSYRRGNYMVTKTMHFLLHREGNISYDNIPADGSKKMQDILMESIEPFFYNEMCDFSLPYLSGYFADKYDVSAEESEPRVNERVTNSTTAMFAATAQGYSSVSVKNAALNIAHGNVSLVLLPIWTLNATHGSQLYTFTINGQTGKLVGKLPISFVKCALWFLGIFAGSTIIARLILMLLHVLG